LTLVFAMLCSLLWSDQSPQVSPNATESQASATHMP
jgi:hypothetical protein